MSGLMSHLTYDLDLQTISGVPWSYTLTSTTETLQRQRELTQQRITLRNHEQQRNGTVSDIYDCLVFNELHYMTSVCTMWCEWVGALLRVPGVNGVNGHLHCPVMMKSVSACCPGPASFNARTVTL